MFIKDDIKYVGIDDHKVDLFESLYPAPHGIAYNSYIVLDEKVAVIDTMDQHYTDEWFGALDAELQGRAPDYLVIHHMEPDHSANILNFMNKYQSAVIVASKLAFGIMQNYFGTSFSDRQIAVGDGSEIELGKHKLVFVTAPMVHWPEVVMSYIPDLKLAFTADAFGKFGTLDRDEPWEDEARRYFFSIVGKFGVQTSNLLKKLDAFEIETVCAAHGPVLTENIPYYIGLYKKWASYVPEEDGICIAYCSVYGHTKAAMQTLAQRLRAEGRKLAIYDLARCDMYSAVTDAFRYSHLLLASTTYYGELFPFMREYIAKLRERMFRDRTVYLVENGSWAPVAAAKMKEALSGLEGLDIRDKITVKGFSTEPISIEW